MTSLLEALGIPPKEPAPRVHAPIDVDPARLFGGGLHLGPRQVCGGCVCGWACVTQHEHVVDVWEKHLGRGDG